MSWIDAANGGADAKIRRVFYVRGSSATSTVEGDFSYVIKDQLPQNYILRVGAQAALSGTVTNTVTSAQLIEVRLYGAFTNERTYDTSQGSFIVMGYFVPVMGAGANATGAGSYIWQVAPPVESRSTGNGVWRVQLFDLSTGATLAATQYTIFAMSIDVRAGGPITYPN